MCLKYAPAKRKSDPAELATTVRTTLSSCMEHRDEVAHLKIVASFEREKLEHGQDVIHMRNTRVHAQRVDEVAVNGAVAEREVCECWDEPETLDELDVCEADFFDGELGESWTSAPKEMLKVCPLTAGRWRPS